jgi:hypothetical protein
MSDHQAAEGSSPPEDEVWGSSDDEIIPDTVRIKREHFNAGYLEGVTASKDGSLQDGFNSGYPTGASIGLHVGRVIGFFQGLGLCDLERAATAELSAEKLFSQEYWTKSAEKTWQGESHPLIEKWEDLANQMRDQKRSH